MFLLVLFNIKFFGIVLVGVGSLVSKVGYKNKGKRENENGFKVLWLDISFKGMERNEEF